MELVQVVEILKQHGWHAKLTCQGYRICVGSFWDQYSLNIKKNYANNKLMINVTSTWVHWVVALTLAYQGYIQFQKGSNAFLLVLLIMTAINIYRSVQESRQVKRLRAFFEAQGIATER